MIVTTPRIERYMGQPPFAINPEREQQALEIFKRISNGVWVILREFDPDGPYDRWDNDCLESTEYFLDDPLSRQVEDALEAIANGDYGDDDYEWTVEHHQIRKPDSYDSAVKSLADLRELLFLMFNSNPPLAHFSVHVYWTE